MTEWGFSLCMCVRALVCRIAYVLGDVCMCRERVEWVVICVCFACESNHVYVYHQHCQQSDKNEYGDEGVW